MQLTISSDCLPANQQSLNLVGDAFEPSGLLFTIPFLINPLVYNMNFIDLLNKGFL